MDELIEFDRMVAAVAKAWRVIPQKAGTIAVNFFKQRFTDQNWIGDRTEPWKKRKALRWGRRETRKGRAILTKTGRLRRSIRKIRVTEDYVLIGTDVPYAQAHNEGFRGKVTQEVSAHTRTFKKKEKQGTGVYSTKTRKERTRTVERVTGTQQVKAHQRVINQRIPRRQYMGQSPYLNQQIERMMAAEIYRPLN